MNALWKVSRGATTTSSVVVRQGRGHTARIILKNKTGSSAWPLVAATTEAELFPFHQIHIPTHSAGIGTGTFYRFSNFHREKGYPIAFPSSVNSAPNNPFLCRSFSTSNETSTIPSSSSSSDNQESPVSHSQNAIIAEGKKRILACALQGDAAQAQEVLDQLEKIFQTTSTTDRDRSDANDSLIECREALLDAWISHQAYLMNQYNDAKNENEHNIIRTQIFQAADYAHQALEKTVPFLSRPAVAIYTRHQQQRPTIRKKRDEDNDEMEGSLEDPGDVLGTSSTTKHSKNSHQVILHRCNAVLTAWARASRVSASSKSHRGIPQRATFLLQRMEASVPPNSTGSSTTSSGSGVLPTTQSYNRVLEAWAWSKEHLRGTMAEQIFQTMLKRKNVKPDGESYRWIIHAWCQSKQKKSAFTATGHLMKFLRRLEQGREEIEPTLDTYHMVMKAWTTADERNAPIKAMSILRIMEYAASKSFCSVPVDETCYRYWLLTSAKGSVIPEQGPIADQILSKLKDQQIIPDRECYSAVIKTYKNAALNPLFGESRERNISRAVELLEELSVAHNRSTLRDTRPSTENFNDVLKALSASSRAVSIDIAETLVTVMESSMLEEEDSALSGIRPNAETFKCLLLVHTKSKKPDKIETAKLVLDRVKNNLATVLQDDNTPEESLVSIYNAFIQVCTSAREEKGKEAGSYPDVLEEALKAVDELRSLYDVKPNSETYVHLLEMCKKHMKPGSERSRVVEDVFQGCCDEGLVDEQVLQALKKTASHEHYRDMVIAKSDNIEGTRMVPEGWTKNVGLDRVITAEGRKAVPLSVHGKYTITKAMKEYKMRKLRSKMNQNVLRAGRLKLDRKERGKRIIIRLDEEPL